VKVYVAGKFQEKERVRRVQALVREYGHEITCDWTVEDDSLFDGEALRAYWRRCAQDDVAGVRACDALILLPHARGKGLWVELGIALALNKRVIVVGFDGDDSHQPCIFCKLPQVEWAPDGQAAVEMLGRFSDAAH
jgi:nucleoside 2-deoxyribosyltransferase